MSESVSHAELPLPQQLLIDRCCLQFEKQWRSGDAPRVEDLLADVDDVARPHLLAELLQIEWELLREDGKQPVLLDYHQRFPQFSAQIESAWNENSEQTLIENRSIDTDTDFEIVSQLGTQASGISYRAVRPSDGSEIDVLVLSGLTPDAAERVKKRIRLASRLKHPAATRIITSHLDGTDESVLLEMVSQSTLFELLSQSDEVATGKLLSVGCQLASVLSAGHRLGLAHGHLTPSTVHIRSDGSAQIDFVRPFPNTETSLGDVIETQFLAPEATGDEPDAAADVFSLTSLLVWMFTGESGEPLSRVSNFRKRLEDWLPESQEKPPALDALCEVVNRALQSDPSDRSTVQEILEQLEIVAQQAGVTWPGSEETAQLGAPIADQQSVVETVVFEKSATDRKSTSLIEQRKQLGRFHILEKLGEGGMGAVYKAVDSSDGTIVAIKVLSDRVIEHPEALRRFRKEARLLGEIKSPYVTNLVEVNEDAGLNYLVMEYVSGTDLSVLIGESAPLDEKLALTIIADSARGLVGAHERGIIHRDIKPT